MTTEQTTCEKCGKKRRKELQGSFTQWIFDKDSCTCDAALFAGDEVRTCSNCGRPLRASRDGSMTQWIFRTVSCDCQTPRVAEIPQTLPDDFEEPGLEMDPRHFPVERYKALAKLGSGASGKVYLCRDKLLRKKVAVKILNMLSNEQFIAFQTEARAMSKLVHPSILSLLDFGPTESGEPYMVLEYFPGSTLQEFIQDNGALNPEMTQQIFLQVGSALALAHNMNIYHRDLKPSNILIAPADRNSFSVKLIDFGTAKVTLQDQAPLVVQGTTLAGTPAYMSPDVASGLAYDARSEIYSLGCVMFEALTGRPPFTADSPMELLSLHAKASPPTLARSGIAGSTVFEELVARCLKKDPQSRFQSMQEFCEALDEIPLQSESTEPSQAAARQAANTKRRGSPTKAIAIVVVIAAISLTSIYAWWKQEPAQERKDVAMVMGTGTLKFVRPADPFNFGDEELKQLAGRNYTRLAVAHTRVTGKTLSALAKEPIERFLMDYTKLDESTLPALKSWKHLNDLSLANTNLTNEGLKNLRGLRLRRLLIWGNKGINDESLSIIARNFPNLTVLSVAETSVTNEGLKELKKLKNLKSLDLSDMQINDSMLEALVELPLESIILNFTNVSDRGIMLLSHCESLKELKLLGATDVTLKGVDVFKTARPDVRVLIDGPMKSPGIVPTEPTKREALPFTY